MWRLLTLAALLVALPLADARPDLDASEYRSWYGWASQGSRDTSTDWLDGWMGDDQWDCLSSTSDDLWVLTVLESSPEDVLVLETNGLAGTTRVSAMLGAPAVAYGWSSDLCLEFAVEGAQVTSAARYHVEAIPLHPGRLPCRLAC